VEANLALLAPEITLGVAAALIILLDAFLPGGLPRTAILVLAAIGIVASAAFAISLLGLDTTVFSGAVAIDPFAVYFKLLFLSATLLVLLASTSLLEGIPRFRAEFVGLLLFATVALMLLAAAH